MPMKLPYQITQYNQSNWILELFNLFQRNECITQKQENITDLIITCQNEHVFSFDMQAEKGKLSDYGYGKAWYWPVCFAILDQEAHRHWWSHE